MPIIDPFKKNREVIDPFNRSQNIENQIQREANSQGILSTLGKIGMRGLGDITAGLTYGGEGLHNFPGRLLMMAGAKEENLPSSLKPTNVNWSEFYGVKNPNIIDTLIQGAAQYAPYGIVTELVPFSSGIARAATSGAVGGLTQSENPLTGALLGGTVGAAAGSISTVKDILTGKPVKKAAETVLRDLGGEKLFSSKTPIESAEKEIASDINKLFDLRKSISKEKYRYQDALKNEKILDDSYLKSLKESESPEFLEYFDNRAKKLYSKYLDDPTWDNADKLRKALGEKIGEIKYNKVRGQTTTQENDSLKAYGEARDVITNNINDFISQKHPELQDIHHEASSYWLKNIKPFNESPKLKGISSGEITNPRTIADLFKNPEPEFIDIIKDLPQDTKNKLLFSELSRGGRVSSEDLLTKYSKLDTKKLGSYITPEFQSQMEDLAKKFGKTKTLKDIIKKGFGITGIASLGGILGSKFGSDLSKFSE